MVELLVQIVPYDRGPNCDEAYRIIDELVCKCYRGEESVKLNK